MKTPYLLLALFSLVNASASQAGIYATSVRALVATHLLDSDLVENNVRVYLTIIGRANKAINTKTFNDEQKAAAALPHIIDLNQRLNEQLSVGDTRLAGWIVPGIQSAIDQAKTAADHKDIKTLKSSLHEAESELWLTIAP